MGNKRVKCDQTSRPTWYIILYKVQETLSYIIDGVMDIVQGMPCMADDADITIKSN